MSTVKKIQEAILERISDFEKKMHATVKPVVKLHIKNELEKLEERVRVLEAAK